MKITNIRKVNSFLLSMMIIMVVLLCCSSQVQADQSGDYSYTVIDGKAQIMKYTGPGGVVIGTGDITVTGVSLKVISSSEINLSWNAVRGAKLYTIYRATSENGTYAKVGSAMTKSFKNTSLQPSTSYWYKITVVTSVGESNFSMIQTATTLPSTPSGVSATTVSSTAITIKWNEVVNKTFNVYRSATQKGKYTKIAVGLNNTTYNDTKLTSGTTYYYYVTTLNSDGNESRGSSIVSAVTNAIAPSKLMAQVKSKREIDLSWDKVKGAKSYGVYRAASVDGLYSKVGTTKTASFKNTDLQPGISYWYKINSVTSAGGEGDYSEAIMATTLSDSNDILIGGNLELTGNLSAYGQTAKNAIELAFRQVNEQGGILNGRKLKFIAEDNKSSYNEIATAANILIKHKVVGIVGPLTSAGTTAEIHVATKNRVSVITPSGSSPELTVNESGKLNQWIFRACFIDSVQAKAAAQFALGDNINAKTAAIIIDQNSTYSQGLATAFVQSFTTGGGEVIRQDPYIDGADELNMILTNIKNINPDVVYLPSYYQEAGEIIKQARELGMNMPFIGGDAWANGEIYNIAGVQSMNNTYYTDHVAIDDPAMAQFLTYYQDEYCKMPDAWSSLSFDAAKMYVKAIEIAGSTDTEKIRRALENIKDLQVVSGNITVDPITHNPIRNVIVMENKEGKAVFLTKVGPN